MDQLGLYMLTSYVDDWSPDSRGRPGSAQYERWAAHKRCLQEATASRHAARLERRRQRLLRRVTALDSRLSKGTRRNDASSVVALAR